MAALLYSCSSNENEKMTGILELPTNIRETAIVTNIDGTIRANFNAIPNDTVIKLVVGIKHTFQSSVSLSTAELPIIKKNGKIKVIGEMMKSGGGIGPAFRFTNDGLSIIYPSDIKGHKSWVEIELLEN